MSIIAKIDGIRMIKTSLPMCDSLSFISFLHQPQYQQKILKDQPRGIQMDIHSFSCHKYLNISLKGYRL
jgi:hypothetical protein